MLFYRAMGAAVLDRSMYEGIEHDPRATGQATVVVLASSVAAGIGASGWSGPRPLVLVLFAALALVAWLAWAVMIQQIGGRFLAEPQTRVDLAELLRTTGFAAAPGVLQVFAWFPTITVAVFVVCWIWMLVAMTVAVRQALDFRTFGHALAVCATALAIVLALAFLIALTISRNVA
jgi:hypothetical protein